MKKQHPKRRQTLVNKFEVFDENLRRFVKEVHKFPILDNEEMVELVVKAQEGDKQAYNKVCESTYRMLISIAKEYHTSFLGIEDLIQEGFLGLHSAIKKYKADLNVPFILFAVWFIKEACSDFLWKNHTGVKMPMGNQRHTLSKLFKVHHKYLSENGVAPSDDVLHDLTGASTNLIAYFKQFPSESFNLENVPLCTLSEVTSDLNLKETPTTWVETLDSVSPEEIVDQHIIQDVIRECISGLKPHQQELLSDCYGLDGNPLSIKEMAEKYNCSTANIRQKKDRYLAVLFRLYAAKLKPYLD